MNLRAHLKNAARTCNYTVAVHVWVDKTPSPKIVGRAFLFAL